ncbi:MAG: 2-oxo acid dehydrogenase subunit E2 [Candidatus Hydrogenedentes bacterium]|nr:2-oxo acid dehydrogenase subunit E2 [Candidatus Hydrogenedentota bacterium]
MGGKMLPMFRNFTISYARKNIRMREVRPLSFQRQSVAFVLSEANRKIPLAAGNVEFDMTPVIEYGERVIAEIKAREGKRSDEDVTRMAVHKNLSAFYLKTIAHVVYHVPVMNSILEWTPIRDGGTLYEFEDICPSFTVHTKQGVLAPVVQNPHQRTQIDVANEMRILTRKARRTDMNELYRRCALEYVGYALREFDFSGFAGAWLWAKSTLWPEPVPENMRNVPEDEKLRPKEVIGATTTIANIGMSVDGWQTISAMPPTFTFGWGIGHIRQLPRIIDGAIVPRQIVTMAVVFDHRAMDGGDIFPFVEVMNGYINNPERIFEWKPGDPI